MHSNLQLLSRKGEGYNCIKKETRLWGISGDIHDPLDDGTRLLELAKLSLDEPNLEVMFFLDDVMTYQCLFLYQYSASI